MPVHIALLRAVNVGGTGKLAMADLRAMCRAAGFEDVQTYIASGNIVFRSTESAQTVRAELEKRLHAHAGKPVGVFVLSPADMARVRDSNPFPDTPGNRVMATFLGGPVPDGALESVRHQTDEVIRPGPSVLYILYPEGAGPSKLVVPAARAGTARNMNTVAKLAALAAAAEERPSP